jgi:hypothetical protein
MRRALFVLTAVVALPLAGCAGSEGIGTPTEASAVSAASTSSSARAVSSGLTASALGTGANAGWTCIEFPSGFVCAPPGLGLPSVPPVANNGGAPTYNLSAFTLDHQFVHRFKLLRPDLYHGEPCLGGEPWDYVDFLGYYECIIKE